MKYKELVSKTVTRFYFCTFIENNDTEELPTLFAKEFC